jgi:hypothetical protein
MSDTLEETQPAHAPLGPSSAEGWSTCSDYVNANRGLPDTTTEPAAEGTVAHSISDLCLMLGLDADDFLGIVTALEGYLFAWEEDDALLLQRGLDDTRAMLGAATFYGEQKVDTSPWTLPGQFGTLDRAFFFQDSLTDEWWIVIIDLKWGRGVSVSPVENKQLMLYALAFWHTIARHHMPADARPRFRLVIDQPRHGGGGGIWETNLDDLLVFGDWIRERARLTAEPNPSRTASRKGCMWCRRKVFFPKGHYGGCDTFDTYMLDLLGWTWADLDLALMMGTEMTLPTEMTPERASVVVMHKDAIERWLEAMSVRMLDDALTGAPTGEVKAVLGNKTADKWKDKGVPARPVVERFIGGAGFTKLLKSPKRLLEMAADDEEALAALAPHVDPGVKRPTLVPMADARPAITGVQALLDEEDATH